MLTDGDRKGILRGASVCSEASGYNTECMEMCYLGADTGGWGGGMGRSSRGQNPEVQEPD